MSDDSFWTRNAVSLVAGAVLVAGLVALWILFAGVPGAATLGRFAPDAVRGDVERALGELDVRPVRTLRIRGRQVEWEDGAGRPFFRSPDVAFSVTMEGPGGGVVVSNGLIAEPELRLVQTAEGAWNYEEPLAPLLAEDEPGTEVDGEAATALYLRDVVVEGGYVLLDLLESTYEARALDARLAGAQLTGPGLDAPVFRLSRAEAEVELPEPGGEERVVREVALRTAQFRVLEGAVGFQVAEIGLGGSLLADARGVWNPELGGLGLDLQLTGTDVRLADLPGLPAEVPEDATASFRLAVEPREGDRTAVALSGLDLRAQGSAATGSLQAVIGGPSPELESADLRVDSLSLGLVESLAGPLPYAGTVSGTIAGPGEDLRVDLEGRLTAPGDDEPFTAEVTGRVAVTESGFRVREASLGLERVPLESLSELGVGLPFRGRVTGTVDLQGMPADGPLDLDLRLEAGGGIVTMAGTADLTDTVPSYDVEGRVAGVALRDVLQPAVPPVQLNAVFSLEGRGVQPATADASLSLDGRFTGWETESGDTIRARVRVADGQAVIPTLNVEAGPVRLSAEGDWAFAEGGGGSIRYDVAVENLAPLAPYLPPGPGGQRAYSRGSFGAEGTLAGTLDRPIVEGEITAREFRWGEWAAERLNGAYGLRVPEEGLPRFEVELTGDELRTAYGDFEGATVDIDFGRPEFDIMVRADQEGGGVLELEAGGQIEETGRREIQIRRMALDVGPDLWRLTEPTEIEWVEGDRIRIDGLDVVRADGDGRVALEGVIFPLSEVDLRTEVRSLPIGELLAVFGIDLQVTGLLSLAGQLEGTGERPTFDVEGALSEGSIRGVAIRSISADAEYDDGSLALEVVGRLGEQARVEIQGTLPALLSLEDSVGFTLRDDGALDLRLTSRTFPLATLDPGLAAVDDLQGGVEADLQLEGTPAAPRLAGSARLADAAVTVPRLDRRFREIRGSIELEGRTATVRDLTVRSGGTGTLSGTLDFSELTDPALDLVVQLDGLELQGIEDGAAAGTWGSLELSGSLRQPVLSGDIFLNDGTVSLAPLQQPELSERLASEAGLEAVSPGELDLEQTPSNPLVIETLYLEAGDQLWFATDEARAQLAGTLTVEKPGDDVLVQGTLSGERGTFELAAGPLNRRFRIISAEIRFFGTPTPNPRLDITASRLVRVSRGADVDVRVQVTGTLENPTLSLAAADAANIPESELLSFLLFGRPTSDLGEVTAGGGLEGAFTQGLAYTGLAEVLFSRLTEQIGVDYLLLDYRPEAESGLGLYATAGIEVAQNLVLTVDVGAGAGLGAVGAEYRESDVGNVRFAWEPVERFGTLLSGTNPYFRQEDLIRQFILSWNRRWTY